MLYIYQPEKFDCGSVIGRFWLRLVVIHRQILEHHGGFQLREFIGILSAIDIIIEFAEDLDG